jgi:hypothetical protein
MGRTGTSHMGSAADRSKENSWNVWGSVPANMSRSARVRPPVRTFLVQYHSVRKDSDRQLTSLMSSLVIRAPGADRIGDEQVSIPRQSRGL